MVDVLTSLWNYIFKLFIQAQLELRIIWLISLICFILWFFFVIAIIISLQIKNNKKKKILNLKTKILSFLETLLFRDEKLSISDREYNYIVLLTRDKLSRSIFLEVLLNLHKDFSGEIADNLILIYYKFGFEKDSIKKTKSKKYSFVTQGLRELTLMQYSKINEISLEFLTSKNELIKEEAILSFIKVKGFLGLVILEKNTGVISEWQQICILNTLSKTARPNNLECEKLINSKDIDVQILILKIINRFGFMDNINAIIKLKDSPDFRVRIQVAKIIGNLNLFQYALFLKDWLVIEQDNMVKKAILRSLNEVSDEGIIENLLNQIDSQNFECALKAAFTLYRYKDQLDETLVSNKCKQLLLRVTDELELEK